MSCSGLTNRLLLVLPSHCFPRVGVCLPVTYHLSIFTLLLICPVTVLFHWGFGPVSLCVHTPLDHAVSQKARLPQPVPSTPGFCPHAVRGACVGLPGKVSVTPGRGSGPDGAAAAALAGACWGFCLIRIKDQPVTCHADRYLVGPLLVDEVCAFSGKILIPWVITVLVLVSSPSCMWLSSRGAAL